jgi:hypothetical protein
MKAVRAITRLAFIRRQAPLLASRGAHDHAHDHHESHNPGPPVTYDYIPVPFQKYQTVYGELQSKFNMYLMVSSALLVLSLGIAIADDVFILEAIRPPKSYRERKNH